MSEEDLLQTLEQLVAVMHGEVLNARELGGVSQA